MFIKDSSVDYNIFVVDPKENFQAQVRMSILLQIWAKFNFEVFKDTLCLEKYNQSPFLV